MLSQESQQMLNLPIVTFGAHGIVAKNFAALVLQLGDGSITDDMQFTNLRNTAYGQILQILMREDFSLAACTWAKEQKTLLSRITKARYDSIYN